MYTVEFHSMDCSTMMQSGNLFCTWLILLESCLLVSQFRVNCILHSSQDDSVEDFSGTDSRVIPLWLKHFILRSPFWGDWWVLIVWWFFFLPYLSKQWVYLSWVSAGMSFGPAALPFFGCNFFSCAGLPCLWLSSPPHPWLGFLATHTCLTSLWWYIQ